MLSDWESSLTEFSSESDDEYVPRAAPKKKPKQTAEYKVTKSLQPYRTTTYTAQSLYDQIIDNTIDLDPEYQRDIVWGEAKQSGLIDSILRNFYIPPVIFAVTHNEDGTQRRTCIDGKQRLTSIQRFMDGKVAHKDIDNGKKYWYKKIDNESRALISKPLRQTFANKQITCIEYDGLTEDQEREIFQRVQLGVALTTAERLQAIPGPRPALIREVQSIVLGEDGFGSDLDWGHDRGRDFQCLATIICLIESHPNITFPGSPKLEKWLSNAKLVDDKTRKDVFETFQIFITLVKDKKYNAAFKKPSRVSPVEFTMTGVLIYLYKKTYSLMQLSSAIWQMRADVRKQFADVRANAKVTKAMFQFLDKGVKGVELASDGKGDIPAATAIKTMDSSARAAETDEDTPEPAPKKKKQKRRRVQEPPSSDDSDYEAVRPKRRASMPEPQASTSSSAVPKAAASRPTAARKVSAPVATKMKAASKAAPKASTRSSTMSQPRDGPSSSQSSIPLGGFATAMNNFTSRKTRTAMSAAADSLLAQAPIAEIGTTSAVGSGKQAVETPMSAVKMEIDPPRLRTPDANDDNAMAIDDASNTAQMDSTPIPRSLPRSGKRQLTANVAISRMEPHPDLGDIDTGAIEQMLKLNMKSAQGTPIGSPVVPAPPPPPSISAPPMLGALGQSASTILPRRTAVDTSSSAQATHMPPPQSPILPRTDHVRGRSSDRSRDGDRDRRERSRDRDRERSRDRGQHDFRGSARTAADRNRSRDRDHDRWREPPTREWQLSEAERRRRDRSRERDRYGYTGRQRGY
ncbi:hypothetical protein BD310DRAFT_932136 [Dichomitus squalens]|uniref:GmrSD restriction endonucleases N-terminal domain-containing protein n=1 Tax=Dichomitus squalens TaxID=114155 RepID=A0A4Q9PP44_9APHY|nr:hypothetical protein BD310DRAFT_932136 [Dichomitus squalens]